MQQEIELKSPEMLAMELAPSTLQKRVITQGREELSNIFNGTDTRMTVIVGPCSIHNIEAALEYADKLNKLSERVSGDLKLVMRTYFEKPRTVLGWKGLIYDPDLNGECNIAKGVTMARKLLLDLASMGVVSATELLDPAMVVYLSDLIVYGAIGARTSESQVHRQLASGMDVPVGFKNGTDGGLNVALNAISAASASHSYLSLLRNGHSGIVRTTGNAYSHLILRGGDNGENYYPRTVEEAVKKMTDSRIEPNIIVDCSHGNSRRDYTRQHLAFENVLEQRLAGNMALKGMMLESNLKEGQQALTYGKVPACDISITDACIGFEETEKLILSAASQISAARKGGKIKLSHSQKIAYLGPAATFTHLAALKQFGERAEYVGCSSIDNIFRSVEEGISDYGVVPVENAREGLVNGTMELLADRSLHIHDELLLPIHQCLLSNVPAESIKVIYSHAQSLGQCRRYLQENFPGVETIAVSSNARAAELASRSADAAVIASAEAGTLYNLQILQRNIEDAKENVTRFFVISKEENHTKPHSKSCLCFTARDKIGALYESLCPFKEAGISLSMIESRPSLRRNWTYRFFVELECALSDPRIPEVLQKLEEYVDDLKLIGSYPAAEPLQNSDKQ